MIEKRVKSGLAVTEHHLNLMDENLKRARVRSRNDFTEKAIEFYAGYLTAEENPSFFDAVFTSNAVRRMDSLSKSLGTGQYKIAVELAVLSRLFATMDSFPQEQLEDIRRDCAADVKALNSVPRFGEW